AWELQRAVDVAEFHRLVRPVTLQPQYNLLARDIEFEIVPAAVANGVGLLPWSPLAGGWLTGKYRRDTRPTGDVRQAGSTGMNPSERRSADDRTWDVIEALREIAAALDVPMSQVALRWVADRPGVVSTVLGARTLEQLRDNLATADLELSAVDRSR